MKNISRTIARAGLFCAATLMLSTGWAGPPTYKTLLVFGDSLSDTGNDTIATSGLMPAIPPAISPYATYAPGRFSNGPVAVEYLWRSLTGNTGATVLPSLAQPDINKKEAVNFAFGGSGSGLGNATPGGFDVPGLLGQVDLFKAALGNKKAKPDALYVVWTGSNDYILGLASGPDVVVGNITSAIRSLYAMGARDFLVPNLPDIGLTPLAQAQGAAAQLTLATLGHNALMAQSMTALAKSLKMSRIIQVDIYGVAQTLISDGVVVAGVPALELLSPNTGLSSCLFTDPTTCRDVDLSAPLPPLLFWDVLHPTTLAHGAFAAAMTAAVKAGMNQAGSGGPAR